MSRSIHRENPMKDKQGFANVPHAVGFNPRGPPGSFEPSAKLRSRIEKLAHRRIDPSSITFPEASDEIQSGHATVSGARMNSPRDICVAVKRMRIADDTDLERALGLAIREAEFVTQLSHPNIVKFEGFVEDVSKGIIWLVFPWAHNGNLKDFLGSENLEIPERISLISDVVKGLTYLHNREPPICHGDLKSLNVLVDQYYRVAITDFGSARRLLWRDADPQVESQARSAQPPNVTFYASSNTITLTGNGYTLRWAAPELLTEDRLSLWSDIWALGWIAYEVMTNSLPFQDASSDVVIIERVLGGKLPSLTDNADLSLIHELCSLMTMCWKINPAERPTADFCQRSISQMPMFAPTMNSFGRILTTDRLSELGRMYQSRGDHARAFGCFVDALEDSRQWDNTEQLLSSLRDLAQMRRFRKEYAEAIALHSELWEIHAETMEQNVGDGGDTLRDLAELHRLRNEYSELYSNGREVRQGERITKALCKLARRYRLKNRDDEAVSLYSEAVEISTRIGEKKGRASALRGLADVHRNRKEFDEAIQLYSEVLEIRTDLNDRKGRASAMRSLASVHRHRREYDEAILLYSAVLDIWTELGDSKGRASALWALAGVHRHRNEHNKAILFYLEVLKIRTDLGDNEERAAALSRLADVYRDQNCWDDALCLYNQAAEIAKQVGNRRALFDAVMDAASVHQLLQQHARGGRSNGAMHIPE